MANQKYDQVTDLLLQGRLNWQRDIVLGCLMIGAVFDATHTKISQVGKPVTTTPIQGKMVASGGNLLGQPAFFSGVTGGQEYQLVLVQNDGSGDPKTLVWYDSDGKDNPLKTLNDGTMVIRPGLLDENADENLSSRVWLVI